MLKKIMFSFALAAMSATAISTGYAAKTGLASQTSDERGVKVTVTPQSLLKETQAWIFEVTLETHTQSLNEDLAKSSTLIADGKPYAALDWKGAPPGGHHRKGSLNFKAITPQPQSVELQIRLTGEAAPRTFQWFLKGASNGK